MTEQDTQQNKSLSTVQTLSPGDLSLEDMQARADRLTQMAKVRDQFILSNLKKGIDYGKVEGCGDKKVLLKSGAEKLMQLYGFYPHVTLVSDKEDFDSGIFAYVYRCEIRQIGSNIPIATCEGDASSHENKYRYTWAYESQLPEGVNKEQLKTRTLKSGTIQYRVTVENPADRRNTYRKMAQKRAIVGAVVLATASSSLFATDIELPEDDEAGAGEGAADATEPTNGNGNHGNPISEKQARRLFAIRKEHGIEDNQFSAWLKAKYGYDKDREIGWKVYDEICKAVESGDLEIPEGKPAESKSESKSAGKKIGVKEIKSVYAVLNENKLTEAQFKEWLDEAFPQLKGSGIADLPADNFEDVFKAFKKYVEEA